MRRLGLVSAFQLMFNPVLGDAIDSHTLPVIESCDGCGACCSVQGAPPDYVALSLNPHFKNAPSFAEDFERFSNLDGEPLRLLEGYLLNSASGAVPTDGPCVWLDEAGAGCQFYELRPSTCRVFEINSPGCLYYRKLSGVDS